MKERWLNYILILTNRIYNKKRDIIGREGIRALVDALVDKVKNKIGKK